MADLPSSFVKVNDVEVQQDAPVTEALFAKMGSNDNYLKDESDAQDVDISTINSTLTTHAGAIFSRGYVGTNVSFNLNEPFGETKVAEISLAVKGNASSAIIDRLDLGFNEATGTASYSLTAGAAFGYETRWRLTRQIGAGAETTIVDQITSGSYVSGTLTGDFLGAFRAFYKNYYYSTYSSSSNTTTVYRIYVDFNKTSGAGVPVANFQMGGGGSTFEAIQLR